MYVKANGLPWSELGIATTDSTGRFAYVWLADVPGIYYVRASWSGNEDYAAGDSSTGTVTALPWFFIALLSMTVILVGVGTVVFLISRRAGSVVSEPQPPEIPSELEKL